MHQTVHKDTRDSFGRAAGVRPLVTVIATCYNHSAFVLESLESVRHQTYSPVQLIIMDDYSTDGSDGLIRDWIRRYRVSCTYLRNRRNRGICQTLNRALGHATGKYIAILATDDVWMAGKLEHQVTLMEDLPEKVGVLYSDALQIDEAGTLLPRRFIECHRTGSPPQGDLFPLLVDRNFIPAMTTLIRRSCYRTVGCYDEHLCFEDWDMWLRIAQHYDFAFSPDVFTKRRVVSTSMTSTVLDREAPEALAAYFRVNAKLMKSGRLGSALTAMVTQRLVILAERMYQRGCPWRTTYVLRAFLAERRRRTLIMALCALVGMSYGQFCRIFDWLASARRGLLRGRRAVAYKLGLPGSAPRMPER